LLAGRRCRDPWSRREAEAAAGNRHREQFVANSEPEVVHLVDHQEVEPVPDSRHGSVRALERSDGHVAEVAAAVAQPPDVREASLL
jgi:hypothetical protein